MAKAIASGDPRLMQKAGLEAELARLDRLHAAHFDDQHAIRRAIHAAERSLASASGRIAQIEQDIAQRTHTRGDLFTMDVAGKTFIERKDAGAALLKAIRYREFDAKAGEWRLGNIGGFELAVTAITLRGMKFARIELTMQRTGRATEIEYGSDLTALGLISRLEYCLGRFEVELTEQKSRRPMPPTVFLPIASVLAQPSPLKERLPRSAKSSMTSTRRSPPTTPARIKLPPDPLPRLLPGLDFSVGRLAIKGPNIVEGPRPLHASERALYAQAVLHGELQSWRACTDEQRTALATQIGHRNFRTARPPAMRDFRRS